MHFHTVTGGEGSVSLLHHGPYTSHIMHFHTVTGGEGSVPLLHQVDDDDYDDNSDPDDLFMM